MLDRTDVPDAVTAVAGDGVPRSLQLPSIVPVVQTVQPIPHSAAPAATLERDLVFMDQALEEARRAMAEDEVPIGCVVVAGAGAGAGGDLVTGGDLVIGRGHNLTRTRCDPTAHAELLAISAAARSTGDMRLTGATVYTTVEPCFMCAGALSHARVSRVVWGVRDPKFGACRSLGDVLTDPRLNHRIEHSEGVRAGEARDLLQQFFRSKR